MADIYFTGSGDEAADRKIRRDLAAGKMQRVAQGVYIDPGTETVEEVILRNWTKIAAHLVSDGVVTDRSGIEARPFRADAVLRAHVAGAAAWLAPLDGGVRGPAPG